MSPCLFMKHFQQLYVRHTFVAISFRNIFRWEDPSAVILHLLQNRMTFAIEKENAYWSSELPWIMLSIYYFCFFSHSSCFPCTFSFHDCFSYKIEVYKNSSICNFSPPCFWKSFSFPHNFLYYCVWVFERYIVVEYYFNSVKMCYICVCCRILL